MGVTLVLVHGIQMCINLLCKMYMYITIYNTFRTIRFAVEGYTFISIQSFALHTPPIFVYGGVQFTEFQ